MAAIEPDISEHVRRPRFSNFMVCRILPRIFATSLLAAGCSALAQTAADQPAGTVAPAPAAPRRARVISPEVAAQLSAAAPKFTPPPPAPVAKPAEEETDLRDVDKPKNEIIRLPKFIVREPRPPMLTERAVNTKKGLADIAVRRYISEVDRALNGFALPFFGASAEQRALEMYAEDERLKNMADLQDSVRMVNATNKAAGANVKREVDRTFAHPADFDWKGGPK
jgi:hypothetical protein